MPVGDQLAVDTHPTRLKMLLDPLEREPGGEQPVEHADAVGRRLVVAHVRHRASGDRQFAGVPGGSSR